MKTDTAGVEPKRHFFPPVEVGHKVYTKGNLTRKLVVGQFQFPRGSQTMWHVGNLGHEKARIDRRGLAWAKGRNGSR
jgi:hypothetical protein